MKRGFVGFRAPENDAPAVVGIAHHVTALQAGREPLLSGRMVTASRVGVPAGVTPYAPPRSQVGILPPVFYAVPTPRYDSRQRREG